MRPGIALVRGFSAVLAASGVHCVLARISPVAVPDAVHGWSAPRAREEVSGVGQGTAEVDVWRASPDLEKLIVGQHSLCEGLLLLLALGSESMGCHAAEGMDFPGRPRGRSAP